MKRKEKYEWTWEYGGADTYVQGKRTIVPVTDEEEEVNLKAFWRTRSLEEKVSQILYFMDNLHRLPKITEETIKSIIGFKFYPSIDVVCFQFEGTSSENTKDFIHIVKTVYEWDKEDRDKEYELEKEIAPKNYNKKYD